ncbi:MAG: YIP1 family protein [Betaproteobacteria bacterium]|nr:MAG: YIP1 family protein [Betaproteobacteria bacterium]
MNVVDRVKNILINPKQEWPKIAAEPATVQSLYVGYIMILAAIGPLAIIIRGLSFGSALGLPYAIGMYLLSLVAVSIVALIVDLLAPTFGGQRDYVASLKLVAYAYTAVWIAGIFRLIPAVGGIIGLLAGIYSLYTFYLGAAPVKKCPAEKAVGYTIIVLICNIVLFWLLGLMVLPMMVGGGIAGLGTMGMMR